MARGFDIISGKCLTTLIGVNLLLFVAVTLGNAFSWPIEAELALPGSFAAWMHKPWTLITYMFTQAGFIHLLFNMLWLLWFGGMYRAESGGKALLTVYLTGGLAAALLFMSLDRYPWLMGSSAAVFSVMAATALTQGKRTLHLFFMGDVQLRWVTLIFLALGLLATDDTNMGGRLAHLAGICSGALAGCLLKRHAIKGTSPKNTKRKNPFRNTDSNRNVLAMERQRTVRLDALLDKIHTSGFDSLSKAEKQELQYLSTRVSSNSPKK